MGTAVNICTALRQGSQHAGSFFNQVWSLSCKNHDIASVTVVVDGEELTDETLISQAVDPRVRFVYEGTGGGKAYFMDERSAAWAKSVNLALEASLRTPSDFTLWIESDLSFPLDLVELLAEPRVDIVAPVVMLGLDFYDAWGFRDLSGRRIDNLEALKAQPHGPGRLIELSSVGSCLLFRSEILASGVRLPNGYKDGLLVGFCKQARGAGFRVFCRPDVTIVHPTSLWQAQIYRVISCRVGNGEAWRELAPAEGVIVAGPYFDFVTPALWKMMRRSSYFLRQGGSFTFAANGKREVALLLSKGDGFPPLPEGGDWKVAPAQRMGGFRPGFRPWKPAWWRGLVFYIIQ